MTQHTAPTRDKPLIIHIKPYIQGGTLGIKPTYGITKVAIINGELTYITENDTGNPLYIPSRWVRSTENV